MSSSIDMDYPAFDPAQWLPYLWERSRWEGLSRKCASLLSSAVTDTLFHSHSAADLMDEDDDNDGREPPPVPRLDNTVVNGA